MMRHRRKIKDTDVGMDKQKTEEGIIAGAEEAT